MKSPKRNITETPFFIFMGFLGDIVYLNLLWLLCCLPVVTAGAATSAAFSVACKMAAKDDYLTRPDFMAAFKRDFPLATKVWLTLLAAGAVIAADYQIGTANSGGLGGALIALAAAMGLIWLCILGGGYALLSRFTYRRVRDVLRDSLTLCAANPKAAATWLILVLLFPAMRIAGPVLYSYLLPPWLLVGGGVSIVSFAYALRPAFEKIENKRE